MNGWFKALSAVLILLGCAKQEVGNSSPAASKEIKGISYESPSSMVDAETFAGMPSINANYVALIPFGFVRPDDPQVQFDLSWQWWGERSVGIETLTKYAHQKGLKVMIKPQVWIGGGGFTGTYQPSDEAGWQTLEQSYRQYIIRFARLAEQQQAEMFCVGTEFKAFMVARPAYWGRLIDSVRSVYSGKLTYAGNWDSYKQFPHWAKLDFIGIDAYFPLSDSQTPSVTALRENWQGVKAEIKAMHMAYDKPVVFTEYGYRSVDYCAKTPWESGSAGAVNLQAQINAYQAVYEEFWSEPWFEGGFLWKWHPYYDSAGGPDNNRFTPQNKPVEATISEWYGK